MNIVHTLSSTRLAWKIGMLLALIVIALEFYPSPSILAQSPPATPSSVAVTRADGTLTASGYTVANATKYHITYSSDGGASWSLAALDHSEVTITISADNAKSYIVGVRAGNSTSWSGWRNSPSIGPYTPLSPPATPASVTATRADGSITASWHAVDSATSYHVTYTDNDAQSWQLAALDHPATTGMVTITITADNSKSYIVGVRAKNAHGGSNWVNSPSVGPYTPPPPPPPASVASVSVDRADGTLTASWQAVASATSYHVTYTDNDAQSWQLAALDHPATTGTVTITITADNDKSYIVGVRAKNAHGGSNWVNSPSVGPYTPPPGQPTGLNAEANDDGSATITWDDPNDASITGYQYQTREEGGAWGGNTEIEGSGASTTSHTITGLVGGATNHINLQAVNASGASQGRQVSVKVPAMLAGPDSVTITTRGTGTLTASWTAVPDTFNYYIKTSNSGDDWKTLTIETHVTGTSVTLSNRNDNLNYTVLVQANAELGFTSWTESYPAGTSTSPAIAPESVSLSRSGTTLTATWPAVVGAASYNVESSTDNGATWTNETIDHTTTTWTKSSIGASTSYKVRVQSKNTAGTSAWTESDENTPAPPAPDSVTVTSRSHSGTNATLAISWDAVTRATGYNIRSSGDNGATWTTDVSNHSSTTLSLTLTDNTKDYFIGVQAVNSNGTSGWTTSAISRATPLPPAPANLSATRAKGSITITWDAASGTATYDIACSMFGGYSWNDCKKGVTDAQRSAGVTFTQIFNPTANATQNITDLREYNFAVRGRNTSGAGEWTRVTAWQATPVQIASVTASRTASNITLTMTAPANNGGYTTNKMYVDCRTSSDGGTTWSGWFVCTDAQTTTPTPGAAYTATIDSTDSYDATLTYQARARAGNGIGDSWYWRESAAIPPITLTAGSIGATTATLTIAGHTGSWYAKKTAPTTGTCSSEITGTTHSLSSLNAGTTYTYKAYNDSACTTEIASETFSTPISFTASSVTTTSATLTLAGHTGAWSYEKTAPSSGSCVNVSSGYTASLSSLTAGAWYTYKSYSGSGCSAANELASETFATSATLTASGVSDTAATLTLASATHTTNWSLKETAPNTGTCANQTSAAATLTLAEGTTYTYKAYSGSGCTSANEIASETFTTHSLTASAITPTTATLTLAVSGLSGAWYYKANTGPDSACQTVSSGTTDTLTGLTADTLYEYTAYSDSNCAAAMATEYFSTTDFGVGNLAETAAPHSCDAGYFVPQDRKCAIAFTTGNRASGYTLQSVSAHFADKSGSPSNIIVAIHAADTTNSSNPAASAKVTLSGSNPDTAGLYTFTCSGSGCNLAANTTYFVVMSTPDTAGVKDYRLRTTSSDDEARHPTANGWSIGNAGRYKTGANPWADLSNSRTGLLHIAVNDGPGVSNLSETSTQGSPSTSGGAWLANAFTTGSNTNGYTVVSATAPISPGGGGSNVTLRIFTNNTHAGNTPGTLLATLTNTGDTAGSYTFSCSGSGCDLAASTSYFLVLSSTSGWTYRWASTASDNDTGGGWSIGNVYKASLDSGTSWANDVNGNATKFAIAAIEK